MSAIYTNAARLIGSFLSNSGGLKSLIFNDEASSTTSTQSSTQSDDKSQPSARQAFKLVAETLRYKPILDELIATTKLRSGKDKNVNYEMMLVMLYDLLFGAKSITGGGQVKRIILEKKTPLSSALARLMISRGCSKPVDLLPVELRPLSPHPRYARINTLCTTPEAVFKQLETLGFKIEDPSVLMPEQIESMPEKTVYIDREIPQLLCFHPSAGRTLIDCPMIEKGELILQDKASCFPAYCLNPLPTDHVIDGCSAPGNKTSHVLAVMHEKDAAMKGRVDAFEVHQSRFTLMRKLMKLKQIDSHIDCTQGCHKSETKTNSSMYLHHASFTTCSPDSEVGSKVTAVMLDPTCSGTGMRHSIERYYKQERQQMLGKRKRDSYAANNQSEQVDEGEYEADSAAQSITSLADFQVSLLVHSLKFPNVTKIVYSTCSIHDEENEKVVARFLNDYGARNLGWSIERNVLPTWKRRGNLVAGLSQDECNAVIRCDQELDKTNGFFVCKFVKDVNHKPDLTRQQPVSKPVASRPIDQSIKPPVKPSSNPSALPAADVTPSTSASKKKKKKNKAKKQKIDS